MYIWNVTENLFNFLKKKKQLRHIRIMLTHSYMIWEQAEAPEPITVYCRRRPEFRAQHSVKTKLQSKSTVMGGREKERERASAHSTDIYLSMYGVYVCTCMYGGIRHTHAYVCWDQRWCDMFSSVALHPTLFDLFFIFCIWVFGLHLYAPQDPFRRSRYFLTSGPAHQLSLHTFLR